jgi:hypothetical protein
MRIDQNLFCLYNREPTLKDLWFETRDSRFEVVAGHTSEIVGHDFLTPRTNSCEEMAEACDQRQPPIIVKENLSQAQHQEQNPIFLSHRSDKPTTHFATNALWLILV